MPELKHNFLKGRMNKDLDERLVPNGEYRDALNVEVSTSEESNVGAVQTTRGNIKLSYIPVTENTKCVGEVVDEKNDKLYWLVSEAGTKTEGSNDYILCDLIMEYDKPTEIARPIVVDIFETQVAFTGYDIIDRKNRGQTNTQAISGAVSTSGGAIAGGSIGAAIGTAIFPGVGTVIGGILGSFIGASAGSNISDTLTGVNKSDKRRKEEVKKYAPPQASLFSTSLDTFDVVLDKFAKLRASDFDTSKRDDRDFIIPVVAKPGSGSAATKIPTTPKTPKVPPRNVPNPITETIKDVGLIVLGVGLVVGATVLAGPTGPDDVVAYGTFAKILTKTKLGQQILKNGPRLFKFLRNADTVNRMNNAIRNKKNFPKVDKANLQKVKEADKIIKNLRKEGNAEKILRESLTKTLREEKNFNLKFIRTYLRKSTRSTPVERIDLLDKTLQALKSMRQGISSRGVAVQKAGKDLYKLDSYKKIMNAYSKEIKKLEQAINFIKKKNSTINDAIKRRRIKKIQRNLNKNKSKSDLISFSTFEGDNSTNVFNQSPPIAINRGGDNNQINMIELNGYMRQV